MSWLPILGPIIDEVLKRIPDPNERARERARIESEMMQAEERGRQGQIDINKQEAAHASIFVAGWRPAVGWILALALFAQYIGRPLLAWASSIFGWPIPPELDLEELLVLLGSMLGMGTLRTIDKKGK